MLENINIKEIKNILTSNDANFLSNIIKEENPESILASLNKSLINKYFKILVKSKNIFLYLCKYKNQNVGYAILAKRTSFLIDEFKDLKYQILINLIINLKFKTIVNILLSLCKFDLILLSKKKKEFINNNLNLNLLAITKKYQSKGIGKEFVLKFLDHAKKKDNFNVISVETHSKNTEEFYKKKLDFYYIGNKIRLFKNLNIFQKNL